jgi:beta-glucosidase
VTLKSTVKLACRLDRRSTVGDWLEDPLGKQVFEPLFEQMMGSLRALFGGGESGPLGVDVMSYLLSLPLPDFYDFPGLAVNATSDEIVAGLLKQVKG